jgi:Flp pilus assembly protein TadG
MDGNQKRRGRRGQAALEAGLIFPWLIFSFMGAYDFGIAAYSLISTQSAARAAASWAALNSSSSSLTTTSCSYALDSLRYAPNVGTGTTSCSSTGVVNITTLDTAAGSGTLETMTVTVTYKMPLMAIPGIMPSTVTINRKAVYPVRS